MRITLKAKKAPWRNHPASHQAPHALFDSLPARSDLLRLQRTVGNAAVLGLLQRDPADKARKDRTTYRFPWIGLIVGTSSAALRRRPSKDPRDPHRGTLADLAAGDVVEVIGRKDGWWRVRAEVDGTEMEGYVSHELVLFNRWDLEPEAIQTGLSFREALVVLKRAETQKKSTPGFKPSKDEQTRIDAAIATVKLEPKWQVDEATYLVTFAKKPGQKIKISSIYDFVLFVEAVEAQYPSASAKEVISEVRQVWFSDPNWDVLVGSEGIKEGGKLVDIETAPNPIAMMFDMRDLAPDAEGKVLSTPMGAVNIGHVLAGIDARLSGSPAAYPKDFLKARGEESAATRFKYEKLTEYDEADPTMFATFAGDLGQAYATFIFDHYHKKGEKSKLATYVREFAKPEELLGDIHGYIAAAVAAEMRASGSSPTGASEVKASSIIRDMYLVDHSTQGASMYSYMVKVAGKGGKELHDFIYARALDFATLWYAKVVADNEMEIWLPADLFDDYVQEFAERSDRYEQTDGKDESLSSLVDDLIVMAIPKLQ